MAFDVSRFTFDAWKDYFGVVMEQGRVQTDADWNEWLAEFARRVDAGTLDIVGRAVVPATTPDAFSITIPSAGSDLTIGCGRMYVDGLLVENHGPWVNGAYNRTNAVWDPALEEMSGAPQPAPPAGTGQTVDFTQQRYYPGRLARLAHGRAISRLSRRLASACRLSPGRFAWSTRRSDSTPAAACRRPGRSGSCPFRKGRRGPARRRTRRSFRPLRPAGSAPMSSRIPPPGRAA